MYRCGDYASGLEIEGLISEFKAVRTQRANTNVAIKQKRTIEIPYISYNNENVLKLLHLLLLSFFLSFFASPLIHTHCRRRGLLLHLVTLNDTHTHTLGRASLDWGSARSGDLYLTTHSIHRRRIPMPQAGFETAVPSSERAHAYYLDRATTGIGEFTALLHCRIVACLMM
jgi:hypothetical protein